jgi:uncharacterized protein (TIGR03435 family)
MRLFRCACASFTVFCASLLAQAPAPPAFEVASIKPAPPIQTLAAQIQSGKLRLGMTVDGARVDIGLMALTNLLATAYRVKAYQIVGPDWLRSQIFEIHAKIPEGASKDQVPEMLQALLADRFKLVAHRENKEQPVYALVVSKGGPKLKEADAQADAPPPAEDRAKNPPAPSGPGRDSMFSINTPDGQVNIRREARGVLVTGGRTGAMRVSVGQNGAILMEMSKMTMAALAEMLTPLVDRPVVDRTDLKGSYQVALEIPREDLMNMVRTMLPGLALGASPFGNPAVPGPGGLAGLAAADPSGGAILHAVQQLGLKLESRKAPVETLLIDHIERNPTEN